MSKNPNNSPEQKLAWKANQKLAVHPRFIESNKWKKFRELEPKEPSRVDRHRFDVAQRKASQ